MSAAKLSVVFVQPTLHSCSLTSAMQSRALRNARSLMICRESKRGWSEYQDHVSLKLKKSLDKNIPKN